MKRWGGGRREGLAERRTMALSNEGRDVVGNWQQPEREEVVVATR